MYPRNNYSFFIIYIFFLPAPVRMTVPSSTSFLSADSTEELPRLGQATNVTAFLLLIHNYFSNIDWK